MMNATAIAMAGVCREWHTTVNTRPTVKTATELYWYACLHAPCLGRFAPSRFLAVLEIPLTKAYQAQALTDSHQSAAKFWSQLS